MAASDAFFLAVLVFVIGYLIGRAQRGPLLVVYNKASGGGAQSVTLHRPHPRFARRDSDSKGGS